MNETIPQEDDAEKFFSKPMENKLFLMLKERGFLTMEEINAAYYDVQTGAHFMAKLLFLNTATQGETTLTYIPPTERMKIENKKIEK